MTTEKSRRRNEQLLERIADWLDDGTLKYINGVRVNTVIEFHGQPRGYRYHGCRCKKCTKANNLLFRQRAYNRKIKARKMSRSEIMKFFGDGSHLDANKRNIFNQVSELAEAMEQILPVSAEKSAGLRKLLEAKDCFVRATMEKNAS